MKIFDGIAEFGDSAGTELGATEWVQVAQEEVNLFADATGDHQWIHVDAERAAAGPFGGTIAHGFLTLSLLPVLLQQLYRVDNVTMAVNVGLNKVRFVSPVPVGSRLRANSSVAESTPMEGAVQAVLATTIEVEGSDKPAAVIESIVRYFG
ncbi:MAG: dehydratase [Aeromicrobium sp.]|nr:dehydratase [Aeromicrobium sp.]